MVSLRFFSSVSPFLPTTVSTAALPTAEPTPEPSQETTSVPTEPPTDEPSSVPTEPPTDEPSAIPTADPSATPSEEVFALIRLARVVFAFHQLPLDFHFMFTI